MDIAITVYLKKVLIIRIMLSHKTWNKSNKEITGINIGFFSRGWGKPVEKRGGGRAGHLFQQPIKKTNKRKQQLKWHICFFHFLFPPPSSHFLPPPLYTCNVSKIFIFIVCVGQTVCDSVCQLYRADLEELLLKGQS